MRSVTRSPPPPTSRGNGRCTGLGSLGASRSELKRPSNVVRAWSEVGVTAAAALSSEKHSVTSPDAALELSCTVGDEYVLGMKWSATHAPYQPLSSAYRMSESTRSHGCDWLGQTENRTSVSIRTMFQR